jgi:hypothetical protein
MRFGPLDNAGILTWLGIFALIAALLFIAWWFG